MRTFLILVLALTLTGCPKQVEIASPAIETPDEKLAKQLEAQLADMYERFVKTCQQQAIIGQQEWFLSCSQSLGYAIEGYPHNTCTEWSWLSHGILTRSAWASRIVEIDKARTGLTQLWLRLPESLRSGEAIKARGMNPWVIDPYFEWMCPQIPDTP